MKLRIPVALTLAAVVPSLFIGCQGQDAPSAESTPEGLTILGSPDEGRLSAVFRKGDRVVFFESARGRPVPEEYRGQPGFPEYEMDARFVDAKGRAFVWQRGGDEFVDSSWRDSIEAAVPAADLPEREADFELAREASAALLKTSPPKVEHHTGVIARLASRAAVGLKAGSLAPIGEEKLRSIQKTTGEVGHDQSFGAGYYRIEIWKMSIASGMGEHSATVLWKYDATAKTISQVGFACNHGQCGGNWACNTASDGRVIDCPMGVTSTLGQMSLKCSSLFYNTTGVYQNDWYGGTSTTTYITGACKTPYNWNSPVNYHHCHDDTWVQVRNVSDPGYSNNGFADRCSDSYSRWTAPDCDVYNSNGIVTLCGDGVCGPGEDYDNCSKDCGVCGDGVCLPVEIGKCAADCQAPGCRPIPYSTRDTNTASLTDADSRLYTVQLAAGTTYTISMCDYPVTSDAYLRLYNGTTQVAYNDDGCSGNYGSKFTYKPTTTGPFTLVLGCNGSSTCSGTVTVSPAPPNCSGGGATCGNGVVEAGEQCDGGACCNTNCTFKAAGTECRAAAGACDAAETCSGTASTCPTDAFKTSGTICRAAATECDVAETCTGTTVLCTADTFKANGTACTGGTCQSGSCASAGGGSGNLSLTGLSGSSGSQTFFTFTGNNPLVTTSLGSGDADLYVRKGAAPDRYTYDCVSAGGTCNESCSMSGGNGTYYIMLRGYSSYSGVTLTATGR